MSDKFELDMDAYRKKISNQKVGLIPTGSNKSANTPVEIQIQSANEKKVSHSEVELEQITNSNREKVVIATKRK